MKKVLSIVLSIAMVACMAPSMAFAATTSASATAAYSDTAGTACEGAVNVLSALGVVDGYTDGTYRPEQTVKRAEMAKLIVKALGVANYASATASKFTDMSAAQWAIPYVEYASNLNIVNGVGNNKFSPDKTVTYEQAATMIVRALGYTDSCNEMNGSWPAIYIQKATALGLFNDVVNKGATGATRGDIAIMLYNALNVFEVYADNDGATHQKQGSDGQGVTMMDTLNINGRTEYKVVTDSDADTAVNSIAGYVGAAAEVTYNKDGDVIALSDIKTTFLDGTLKSNGKFEVGDTTYTIASDALKVFDETKTGTAKTSSTVPALSNNVMLSSDRGALDADTEADKDFTLAATVSGKTITGIYSIGTWTISSHKQVSSSDINNIEKNQKLLSKKFALNDDQDIDTGSFVLNGVSSLSEIKADNIVYVYVGSDEITRVDVGTKTVTGTITKKTSSKVTIDGTAYEFADDAAVSISSSDFDVDNEVTLYLDYSGDIYEADLVDGTSGNFAVVISKADNNDGNGPAKDEMDASKVKLLTADGVKTYEINGSKYEDNKSLAWSSVTRGTLVRYSVNNSSEITKLLAAASSDYSVVTDATGKSITKAGYIDGYGINDSAVIYAVPVTGGAFDYSDTDDLSVVKKASVLDTDLSLVTYVVDTDTNKVVCMIMDDSATSEDTYGIVTGKSTISGNNDGADFYIGTEQLKEQEVSSGYGDMVTVENGGGLYKITKTTAGSYKFETVSSEASATAAAYEVKNDYVQLVDGGDKYNLYSNAVVYVYDKSDDEYTIGSTSDLTDDDATSIKLYSTSTDKSDDDYGLINYIVITMK